MAPATILSVVLIKDRLVLWSVGVPFSRTGEVFDTGPSKSSCPHVSEVVFQSGFPVLARVTLLSDLVIRFLAKSR